MTGLDLHFKGGQRSPSSSVTLLSNDHIFDTLEEGPLILQPPILQDASDIPFRGPAKRQKGLGLRCQMQSVVDDRPEQWLDPIAIPCSDEKLLFCIVQTQRELSAQMSQEIHAIFEIKYNDNLTITVALEIVFSGELLLDLLVIVELAIHDNMYLMFFVVKWLLSSA